MASRIERNGNWSIVFSRMKDGKQQKKTYALGTDSAKRAEAMKVQYGVQYERGEIDPFGSWTPQIARKQERRERVGTILSECVEDFLDTKAHVKEATREEYRKRLEDFSFSVGQSMPVRLIEGADIRSYCFDPEFSRAAHLSQIRPHAFQMAQQKWTD